MRKVVLFYGFQIPTDSFFCWFARIEPGRQLWRRIEILFHFFLSYLDFDDCCFWCVLIVELFKPGLKFLSDHFQLLIVLLALYLNVMLELNFLRLHLLLVPQSLLFQLLVMTLFERIYLVIELLLSFLQNLTCLGLCSQYLSLVVLFELSFLFFLLWFYLL